MYKRIVFLFFILAFFSIGSIEADTFTDNFGVSRNYLSEGVGDTGWDGFLGLGLNETVDKLSADIDRAGQLYIQSTNAFLHEPWIPLAPFLYKIVSGDFVATVKVTEYQNVMHNNGSLMARASKNPDEAGAGEDWVSIDYFPIYNCGNFAREANNDVRNELCHNGLAFSLAPFLQLERSGDTFHFRYSFNRLSWTELGCSPITRTDLTGLSLQVGLAQATYSVDSGYIAFDDFELIYTPIADDEPPTPNPAEFEKIPAALNGYAIWMKAVEGEDNLSSVQYYFDETSGNPGGSDSGWQSSRLYIDSGLSPDTTYTYTVKMKDSSDNQTDVSAAYSAKTAGPDTLAQHRLIDLDTRMLDYGLAVNWINAGTVGGIFNCAGTDPAVEDVDGRKAVTFDGSDKFQSSFSAPASITGNGSFTVAVWVNNPTIEQEESMVNWAHRGGPALGSCAQVNYGYDPQFGAVTHWGAEGPDMGFDGGVPASGFWHHIAVTFDGSVEKVYVDGSLNATEAKILSMFSGDPVYLGCADGTVMWFSGSIASVQVYDTALVQSDVQAIMYSKAWNPLPEDGGSGIEQPVILQWNAANDAAWHDVYFDSDFNSVSDAENTDTKCSSCTYRDRLSSGDTDYAIPEVLQGDKTYYWRIDEVNSAGIVKDKGDIWSFTVWGQKASCPNPRDLSVNKGFINETSFKPGIGAGAHLVYFGQTYDDVLNAQPLFGDINGDGVVDFDDAEEFSLQWLAGPCLTVPCADVDGTGDVDFRDYAIVANDWLLAGDGIYKGYYPADVNVYQSGYLTLNQDYYWRIDEVNALDSSVVNGDVWTFTTMPVDEIVLSNDYFDISVDWATGALMLLKNSSDANNSNFLLSKTSYPQYNIDDSYWLGDVIIKYRVGGGSWQDARTALSDDIRLLSVDNPSDPNQINVVYNTDSSNPSGIRNIDLTEGWSLAADELVWEIKIKNRSGQSMEIGDLGVYFPFRTLYDGDTTEIQKNRFVRHDFVSGHGSFIFVNRVSGTEPYLVVTPSGNTKLEYFDQIGFMYESIPIMYVHSGVTGPATAGTWRQPHTTRTVANGQEITYGFRFQWAEDFDGVRDVLYENEQFDVKVVPGMTVPKDLKARVAIRTKNTLDSLTAEFPANTIITYLGEPVSDTYVYEIEFSKLGENLIIAAYDTDKYMVLEFFVTEDLETIIKKRSAHLINYQQVVDPSKWYDGLIGPWDMRNSIVRTPDNTDGFDLPWWQYVICTDDSALGHPAYVAQKNAHLPNQTEISGIEYYIENFVWGGLQRTDLETYPYCIYGVPNWYYNRANDPLHIWRVYDYPHIFMMYYHMYEIAKLYPDMVSYLDKDGYLERAYQTAMAYFITTDTIPGSPQHGLQFRAGTMNEVVLLNIIEALQEEGRTADADALAAQWDIKVKYFIYDHPYPYVSEFPYDTTAYESSYAICKWAMENPLQPDPQHPVVSQDDVVDFMHRQHLANIAARGWLEPAYYHMGSDFRGACYRLSYMSQMGGWSVLDYALNYASAEDANDYIQLGYASALSSWALMNTGTAATSYGFWYPGLANDGASGWGFQTRKTGPTWLQGRIVNRGPWYYDGEIELGFSGGVRSACSVVTDDNIFGLFGFGCDVFLSGNDYMVVPKDGLRERLYMMNLGLSIELNRDAFLTVLIIRETKDYITFYVENESGTAHTTELTVAGLAAGTYSVKVDDIEQLTFEVTDSNPEMVELSIAAGVYSTVVLEKL